MKRVVFLWIIFIVSTCVNIVLAAHPSDFRFKVALTGHDKHAGMPVRLALGPELISKTAPVFSDLRLFDDHGQEIPFVIYEQRRQRSHGGSFTWKIFDYHVAHGIQTIYLKRPDRDKNYHTQQGDTGFNNIEIITTARDFNKKLQLFESADRRSWKPLVSGSIYDFTSEIDLRKTTIGFTETKSPYLKLIMSDDFTPVDMEQKWKFHYQELTFSFRSLKKGEIKIIRFSSELSRERGASIIMDHLTLPNPELILDREKNTVIELGYLNLPLEQITLQVRNKFFYRQVELWISQSGKQQEYARTAAQLIYRIPGIKESKNTLLFDQPRRKFVILKVINHDNPPLQVSEVKIEWPRRHLYFIPESERLYTLYLGGTDVEAPTYELQKLIPYNHTTLSKYPQWTSGLIKKNDQYAPRAAESVRTRFEKYTLITLILILVSGLGFWMYHLMQKIPEIKDSL
ncbi:hypothetical protein ACFL27_08410 [candidate division CSSED10-310 bacterium]|uniref:DUF3999 family protein n=1 Tax=candidate division CSSED10-310 bacterium TaxID=2855610 RepID=A0ABV6YVW0_UNCC1